MRPGAATPEELETLFEDAFLVRDREALAGLFDDGAVLVAGGADEARGAEIGRLAEVIWSGEFTYLAAPRRVLQANDTGLVVAERGINVVRRGGDRRWRYAISLLDNPHTIERMDR